jgi:hypothetical protein
MGSDTTGSEPGGLYPEIQPGRWAKHPTFGFGLIKERQDSGDYRKDSVPRAWVEFPGLGSKWLALRYARLETVDDVPPGILRELARAAPLIPKPILPASRKPRASGAAPGHHDRGVDREKAARLGGFFRNLAGRIEQGHPACPAEFMRLAGSGLSLFMRLQFRLWFLERLCHERATRKVTAWRDELRLLKHLLKQRKSAEDAEDIDHIVIRAGALAITFREAQPASKRIWVHATRRNAPDRGLLWAENIARFLAEDRAAGYLDYTLVQDWVCAQPDLRYRFTAESVSRLRALADYWDRCARTPGAPRPNRYRRLPGLLRNIADKFAVSSAHYYTLWCELNPDRVEIDLLTGRVSPESFAIARNENLSAMCRDALKRNLDLLGLALGEARMVLLPSNQPAWNGFTIVVEAALADGSRSFRIDYR